MFLCCLAISVCTAKEHVSDPSSCVALSLDSHTAAAAVVVVAVAVVVAGKWITRCKVFALHCLVRLSPFLLPHVSPSASSGKLCLSSFSSSGACSAALQAARHVRRRHRSVRMFCPFSTRIHHAFRHHVMCLFDTWLSSCSEFSSFFSSPSPSILPLRVHSSPWVSSPLPCLSALPEPSLLSPTLPALSLLCSSSCDSCILFCSSSASCAPSSAFAPLAHSSIPPPSCKSNPARPWVALTSPSSLIMAPNVPLAQCWRYCDHAKVFLVPNQRYLRQRTQQQDSPTHSALNHFRGVALVHDRRACPLFHCNSVLTGFLSSLPMHHKTSSHCVVGRHPPRIRLVDHVGHSLCRFSKLGAFLPLRLSPSLLVLRLFAIDSKCRAQAPRILLHTRSSFHAFHTFSRFFTSSPRRKVGAASASLVARILPSLLVR